MTDLPKELFEKGHPDAKREYHFINIYGEKDSVELSFGDSLSFLICPLDGARIVNYSGDPHTVDICPACNEAFEGNDEAVVRYLDKYYGPQLKERIKGMKVKLNQLEHILSLLENPNNNIKKANEANEAYNKEYNEANLSEEEKESKSGSVVNMKEYSKNERKYMFNESNVRTDGMTD